MGRIECDCERVCGVMSEIYQRTPVSGILLTNLKVVLTSIEAASINFPCVRKNLL